MKHFKWYLLIVVVLYGVQNGNAQEADSLYRIEEDLSPYGGFQIRPETSFVKVGQSQLLRVQNCVLPVTDGKDALSALLFDCNPYANDFEFTPLVQTAKASKWSVNGIVGGNAGAGSIVPQGNGSALYTAPTHRPKSGRIEVSTEIETEGKGKTLLIADIIILDDLRIYHGTVELQGKGEGVSFKAFGLITFKETGYNSGSFNSVSGNLSILYKVDGCSTFKGIIPLAGELQLFETEEDKSVAGGSGHGIAFFTDSFDINCNGINIPQGLLQVISPCETAYGKNKGDGILLVGEGNCGDMAIKWHIEGQ